MTTVHTVCVTPSRAPALPAGRPVTDRERTASGRNP